MPAAKPAIALQLYTVRNPLEENTEAALAQIARIGYTNVEMAGFYGKTPEEFKRLLDQQGLKAICTHEGLPNTDDEAKAAIDRARLFGYDHIAVPWLGEEHRNLAGYRAVADKLKKYNDQLAAEGITLLWHNHDFEFRKLETGEYGEDILLASGVGSELDAYWVQFAGLDPLEWMDKLAGRLPILHCKDMKKNDEGKNSFAEVGTGFLDLPGYIARAPKVGVRYLVVEQDAGWAVSPMESARVGFENLTKMLK